MNTIDVEPIAKNVKALKYANMTCVMCKGSQVCEHGKIKRCRKECDGVSICEHNRVRSYCKECDGVSICEHKKYKYYCPDCGGKGSCNAGKLPYNNGCRHIGNRKYNGFCTFCFSNLFPDDPKSANIRVKSEELKVVSHISLKYNGFYHDKCVCVCGFRRWLL